MSEAALAAEIRDADRTVALTGAGISTASGIPPFRGEDGLWNEWDPNSFHRRRLDADPAGFWADRFELRQSFYEGIDPEPNDAHLALASMEADGQLNGVITQNVDGLHAVAGSEEVVEIHGTNQRVRCDDCGDQQPAGPVFARAADGELPPRCSCGGVLRPAVVLFGESLPDRALERAQQLARECDVMLAVGSSLSVRPASLLPRLAVQSGATLAIVNFEETPRDATADYLFRADVTEVLPAIMDRL